MFTNYQHFNLVQWGKNLPDARILLSFSILLASIMFFLSLIAIELIALALLEGELANSISFPLYEFIDIVKIAWSNNPSEIIQQWLAQPVLMIGYHDELSGLSAWNIYYFLPGIISHLIAAVMTVLYFLKTPVNSCSFNVFASMVIAALFLVTSTFYLSIAAHCAGANWVFEVILRAWQDNIEGLTTVFQQLAVNVPALYLACQWALAITAISIYIILFRGLDPSTADKINL